MRNRSPLLFCLVLLGCHSIPPGTACNGHAELCPRPYNQVSFPATHDAFSDREDGFDAPDQTYPLSRQLADGVRALHLEIYAYDDGAPFLCHAFCQIGKMALGDGLAEVRAFVQANPREVVTLLMESNNLTTDTIASALLSSGLGPYLHVHTPGLPWKTLGQMIDDGDHVVAFLADQTNTGGSAYPFLPDRWKLTWETPWNNVTLADFAQCQLDRGSLGVDHIYVVDTFLEDLALPTAADASRVNYDPFLIERLLHCQAVAGHLPNLALVDYYEVGDLFSSIDVLNGFAPDPAVNLDAFPPVDGGPSDAARD